MSYCQTNVDYSKSDAEFAIIRAGFGSNPTRAKDNMFETHYKGYKEKGVPVGAYWYSYAMNEDDARAEAERCIEVIKGKQFEFPIYYDVEEAKQFKLGKEKVSAIIRAFLSTLEKAGYYVGLYMAASPLKTHVEDDIKRRYVIWVAHWGVARPAYDGDYGVWQIGGYNNYGDYDVATVDYPSIIKKAGLNGFGSNPSTPTPKPEQKPDTEPRLYAGMELTLSKAPLYASSVSSEACNKISGRFWVYDGKIIRGRIRITNSPNNVGRTPIGKWVTGWIDWGDTGG